MFKVGDRVVITGNISPIGYQYFPKELIGRSVLISLKVDLGYEWLGDDGYPWFVFAKDIRPVTKLDKALK